MGLSYRLGDWLVGLENLALKQTRNHIKER